MKAVPRLNAILSHLHFSLIFAIEKATFQANSYGLPASGLKQIKPHLKQPLQLTREHHRGIYILTYFGPNTVLEIKNTLFLQKQLKLGKSSIL